MRKGLRNEWVDMNYLVMVDCNDGTWVYGASDNIDEAWNIAARYNGYVLVND